MCISKINTKETKPKQSLKPKLLKALNMNQFYVGPLILFIETYNKKIRI